MNEFELGWVCGLLEGEAAFSCQIYKHKRVRKGIVSYFNDKYISIRVSQVDKSVLDKLKNITGVGKIRPKKIYSSLSKQPQYEWKIDIRKELRWFLEIIRFHMSQRRSVKIEQMLEMLKHQKASLV